ncbi:Mur ligase family protein [Campylobacter blaseri]|uniref:UDP-N-acetylmuramoylalanyl-D-glutamyl-2, 6-diaminopimelate--D-alanyl-D-alanine ligase n=1 Tax=Campylobacter blaseri TaxID=2042961 RepID=A0A2P8R2N0_9BACT|nr:UDP-N-acetylmuramoyl-tripeptide--D-alanyl-D-alanine ligase [Campylobacter blaseri]PSM52751.1 UDP-N-acetylmuramoylalanyl-D-glutamyl-2, 6-diaminopimelate--D-alanyl-D-alanine ligase [Campylobacter blaseri]PSM54399.1 UDP-N-acetylmuramoylalanyl-D-glutamyl-2, 6-diaminopimelate--D-alanyl-D-alanine ligase [Campylobacter blaseri]
MEIVIFISHIVFMLTIGFYFITSLQWFSYKIERVIFHYTKPAWHIRFLALPIALYFIFLYVNSLFFLIYLYFLQIPSLYLWYKNLDKKLVFTSRVKRFFIILFLTTIFIDILMFNKVSLLPVFIPLILTLIISFSYEKYQFLLYKRQALKKLKDMPNLKIIQITASYGKTSIKNFLYQILKDDFICYKTPRSVNTLAGLIKDINDNLLNNTQIYIAEAGARVSGDIDEITKFLNPQIIVVGEIGEQHIEYFKTIENVRNTKLEALNSSRLEKAFLHSSTLKKSFDKITIYDENLKNVKSTLDGLNFDLEFDKTYTFKSLILGKFNASNLAACIHIAHYLGIDVEIIKKRVLDIQSVEHRLQKIQNDKKFIIDDSFNGNFKGMSDSYELVSSFKGRKVIVTPGIIESTEDDNIKLAKIINEKFDFVIATGDLNAKIFKENIDSDKLFILENKSNLVGALAEKTKEGDLILFSNDAPNFI